MRYFIVAMLLAAATALTAVPAKAAWHRHRHTHYRHAYHQRHAHPQEAQQHLIPGGLARAKLPDGQVITVAARFADRFVGFFTDLFAREGKLPEVDCYSPTGHQRNSLHHWGGACDVGQKARNVAASIVMAGRVTELARRHGLEDGCLWHRDPRGPDCGHIQVSPGTPDISIMVARAAESTFAKVASNPACVRTPAAVQFDSGLRLH